MKSFLKWLVTTGIGVALVLPLAPVLYAVLGGGLIGGLACVTLGWITYWAVDTTLSSAVEGYQWQRNRTRQKKTRMVNSRYGIGNNR